MARPKNKNKQLRALRFNPAQNEDLGKLYEDISRSIGEGRHATDVSVVQDGGSILIFNAREYGAVLPEQVKGNLLTTIDQQFRNRIRGDVIRDRSMNSLRVPLTETSSKERSGNIADLEAKLEKANADVAAYERMAAEALESADLPADIHSAMRCLVTLDGAVDNVLDLDKKYTGALGDVLDTMPQTDLHRMLSQTSVPFKETDEYTSMQGRLRQAQDAIDLANSENNEFVNIDKKTAQSTVRSIEHTIELREKMEAVTKGVRDAVAEGDVTYLVYLDRTNGEHVHLVTPFTEQEQPGHLTEELLQSLEKAVKQTAEKDHLKLGEDYHPTPAGKILTYTLTRRLETADPLENVVDRFSRAIAENTATTLTHAAGLQVHIRTLASAVSGEVEVPQMEQTTPLDDYESLIYGIRQRVPSLPDDPFPGKRSGKVRTVCAAVMDLLAKDNLPTGDMLKRIPAYSPGFDPENPSDQTAFHQARKFLIEEELIQKTGKGLREPYALHPRLQQ